MRKFKRIYFVVLFLTAMILIAAKKNLATNTNAGFSGSLPHLFKDTVPQKSINDTIPVKDTLKITDSSNLSTDTGRKVSTDTFTLKISKDTLSGPVKYYAQDSIVGFMDSKIMNLYGKAKTEYEDMTLTAPSISVNQDKHMISAAAGRDSTGEISDYADMKQADNEFKSEHMEYNFKTQQGITKGTITQQGEMFVHADIVKKVDARTMYGLGTFFTTCNLDHPHFGFRARRSKIINKKLAVTGAIRPEFDSVPVPIYLPFGIFPLYQGRHSGILSPSFERNDQMGLGLSRLGYYQVINDYWDAQVYGNIYSYGSWSVNVQPTYRKRYKYQGSFNFGLQSTRRNFPGDPDYYHTNTYTVNWSHSSDTRSRPGVSFSANVNASSTRYNENIPNSNLMNYNNTAGSSITYSKTWQDKPFSFTVSANHNQNNAARLVTINFPNAAFTVNTVYPFQKKESAGVKKWYEQLGIGYQGSFQNAVAFYELPDTILHRSTLRRMLDTLQWNANQSIPITLSLPPILGGAVMIAPSISYSQQLVDRKATYEWIQSLDTVIAHNVKGINLKQQMSMGISFNTALYGQYNFKNKNLVAIRHVVRPTVSLSYTPDLNKGNYQRVKIGVGDTASYVYYDKLAGLYSRPVDIFTARKFGGINFGLDNNLEMKVRAKKGKKQSGSDSTDTDGNSDSKVDENGFKKIRLIDGFGFTSSYNMFADSMKLSPFNLYFRTNLFDKINLSANGIITPYRLDANGIPTKNYAWQGGRFNIGTLTSASVSMSTSFQSKPKDANKAKQRQEMINQQMNDPMLQADQQRLLEYMQQNPAEFVDFNTPWSINLSYSLTYTRPSRVTGAYNAQYNGITSSTSFNGSFNLTPKWNFSVNGYYDFNTNKIQTFSMSISRDLHCWQLSVNVTPVGIYRYFNFTISPKAGLLQDLKINRNRSFYNGTSY
ncbi:organic solvent tolerance protein OstA [Niabella ginsenosidivorans]|uniref:Organic solvent tolerance protein OstA n=2 Tax=Niabella ginsenosidivorans TaxID=1176587 RepID=A0A1A9HX74_9BACT|nr:organic solvent tolerance protein OstA [Niabella ginsenosidivorans]